MARTREIVGVTVWAKLGEPPTDLAYWLAQPHDVRLAALEKIRQHYIRQAFQVPPRMQTVCTIVELR